MGVAVAYSVLHARDAKQELQRVSGLAKVRQRL